MRKLNVALKVKILEKYTTQSDFASVVGIRQDNLSKVINGRLTPKTEQKVAMAEALGCKVEDLFPK